MSIGGGLIPSALLARMTGRAYWEARCADGRVRREADGIDWLDLPKKGLVDLCLIGPDGTGRGFGNTADATGRLFQLKGATLRVGVGGGGGGRSRDFHLIGLIKDVSGRCICWAYEHDTRRWVGPFEDTFHDMAYRQLGPLNPALLGG